ncbi:MAG: hypothetical protein Q9198_007938, partial [Flavoplaca austrocitrina]
SLAYEYIRTLIHRPAVGSSLGWKASSSIVALADSSKHIIQIIQLLEERRMSFSFCLNKNELLLLSGFGLLFQGLDLNRKGKLMQDSQRLVWSVIAILERNGALGATAFKNVACAMISVDRSPKSGPSVKNGLSPRRKSDSNMRPPPSKSKLGRKQQGPAITCRFSTGNIHTVKKGGNSGRRATAPTENLGSPQIVRSNGLVNGSSGILHPTQPPGLEQTPIGSSATANSGFAIPNLDYLSFNSESVPIGSSPNTGTAHPVKASIMDEFAGLVNSPTWRGPLDSLFASYDPLGPIMSAPAATPKFDWGRDSWTMPADMDGEVASQSIPSSSEEEMTSGEEQSSGDVQSEHLGMTMPNGDGYGMDSLGIDFGA